MINEYEERQHNRGRIAVTITTPVDGGRRPMPPDRLWGAALTPILVIGTSVMSMIDAPRSFRQEHEWPNGWT